MMGTMRAIEHHLLVEGVVFRYDTRQIEDDLPTGEGAFLARSFWFVDNRALMGRVAEARDV
jgi:GH15 family glucan-1,4-alpha-glucosidase